MNLPSCAEPVAKDVKDGVQISTTALTNKVTTKSAFLYLKVVEDGKDFAAAYNSKAENQVVIPKAGDKVKAGAKDGVIILGAKPDDGDATKAQFKISFKFTFTPQIVEAPKAESGK